MTTTYDAICQAQKLAFRISQLRPAEHTAYIVFFLEALEAELTNANFPTRLVNFEKNLPNLRDRIQTRLDHGIW